MTPRAAWCLPAIVLTVVPAWAAAASRDPPLAEICRAVERQSSSCRLELDESLRLGRFKLWAARRVVGLVDDVDAEVRDMLRAVKRVEVSTFTVAGDCRLPSDLAAELDGAGWSRVVRESSDGGGSLVYQHLGAGGDLDGMLVVELDGSELEVVAIRGDVERLLAAALAGDEIDFR